MHYTLSYPHPPRVVLLLFGQLLLPPCRVRLGVLRQGYFISTCLIQSKMYDACCVVAGELRVVQKCQNESALKPGLPWKATKPT